MLSALFVTYLICGLVVLSLRPDLCPAFDCPPSLFSRAGQIAIARLRFSPGISEDPAPMTSSWGWEGENWTLPSAAQAWRGAQGWVDHKTWNLRGW